MAARLLKLHVVLMESINSMLGNLSRNSRNISLELLSARVSVRKRLGFLREAGMNIEHTDKGEATIADQLQDGEQVHQKSKSITLFFKGRLIKPHSTIISALSMKQVRPYALEAMKQTIGFAMDAHQVNQNMYRYATPDPLQNVPENNYIFLNESERPFALLPPAERKFFTLAMRFHRQWFQYKKEHWAGQASVLCFFLTTQVTALFDVQAAFRIYFVGENVYSQVSSTA